MCHSPRPDDLKISKNVQIWQIIRGAHPQGHDWVTRNLTAVYLSYFIVSAARRAVGG